jgi:hypothetical protein
MNKILKVLGVNFIENILWLLFFYCKESRGKNLLSKENFKRKFQFYYFILNSKYIGNIQPNYSKYPVLLHVLKHSLNAQINFDDDLTCNESQSFNEIKSL